jgi:hypothetical protein
MTLSPLLCVACFALAQAPAAPKLRAVKGETDVAFYAGDQLVTKYVFGGTVQDEKGTGTKPLAKPYFYPLVAPNGVSLTRDWPMKRGTPGETTDHFHQKSAWFCHGDVIPDGIELKTRTADKHVRGVDFWSEQPGHGRIVCVKVDDPVDTFLNTVNVFTTNEWLTPDEDVILNEARLISFSRTRTSYTLQVVSILTTPCGVTFGDTKEGSFGVRIRDDFALTYKDGTGVVTSSSGKSAKAGAKDNLPMWGKLATWNDYSGTVDGKTAGLKLLDTWINPHWAAWHTRAYGLMAANPFGRDKSGFPGRKGKTDLVKLAKGEKLTLVYTMILHDGPAQPK